MLGVALQSAAPLASASCDGHECDSSVVQRGCFGESPDYATCCDDGWMMDANHWMTTKWNANWVPFGPFETLQMNSSAWVGTRAPVINLSTILIAPAPPEGPDAPYPDVVPSAYEGVEGGYDLVTLASGNRVQIRALGVDHGRPGSVSAGHYYSDASWYDPRLHDATFVLLFSGKPGFTG